MKAAGLIAFMGVVFPNSLMTFVVAPVLAFAAFSIVYSYLLFKRKIN